MPRSCAGATPDAESSPAAQTDAARVLVVDDEAAVRQALERALRMEGLRVSLAADGHEALDLLPIERPDVVVLDISMPGLNGVEVCQRIRQADDRTPVLMLTARDAVGDREAGLDDGADDYLVKPFVLAELKARLRALLRRGDTSGAQRPLVFGDLRMDPVMYDVMRGERRIALTRTESIV